VSGRRHIPSLDGIRAIAILLVCVAHLAGTQTIPLHHFSSFGNLGVRVFFVLSGFLISTLLLDELNKSGRIALGKFYWRRTLRIFPPFYAFLLVLAALEAIGWITLQSGDLLHGATYTANFQTGRSWWTGHLWSLAVEEQFYLLWPLALAWGGRRAGWWTAGLTVALAPLWRIASGAYLPPMPRGEWFPSVADALAAGCLLALWRKPVPAWAGPAAAVVLLAANTWQYYTGGPAAALLQTLINLLLSVLLAAAVQYSATWPGRVLNARPLAFLGRISYSVYLWQQLFLVPPEARASWTVQPLTAMLGITGAALLSYYLIEKPIARWRESAQFRTSVDKNNIAVWRAAGS